ncbi:MAG: conjugal transfer protein TraF [Methylophilus sp.]|uniref:conjugal transfer protein TraF n=1 Tax=Methylophilus sp. TaxID=29541 RepID=UPI003FA189F6
MKTILASFLIFTSLSANAIDPFFSDKERGWYWREEPPKEVDEEIVPEKPEPPKEAKKEPEKEPTKPEVVTPPPPQPFTAKWFKENMDNLRDAAIDNPTEDNVAAFYYAQRVAMDKAERFAQVATNVVTADPFLDANSRTPISTAGRNMLEQSATVNSNVTLDTIAQKTGIWFFFRSDCGFCHSQAKILKALAQAHHFKILPISLDGLPLGNDFPDYRVDSGQAAKMNITVTPTIVMATPPSKTVVLGEGFIPLDELKTRIVNQAGSNGTISNEQFATTRIATKPLVPSALGNDASATDLQDPKKLKEYILKSVKK